MKKNRRGSFLLKTALLAVAAMIYSAGDLLAVSLEMHGQYRVMYYADSRTNESDFSDGSARWMAYRFRPLFKSVGEGWSGVWELTSGWYRDAATGTHTHTDSVGGTTGTAASPNIATRQAYMMYSFKNGITGVAGMAPYGDKMDNLWHGDSHTIPLLLAFVGSSGGLDWRFGTAKWTEGTSYFEKSGSTQKRDDIDLYGLDIDSAVANAKIGASFLHARGGKESMVGDDQGTWYGVRYKGALGSAKLNVLVFGASYDLDNATGTGDFKGSGVGGKIEGVFPMGDKSVGLMGVYTSGKEDSKGFWSPSEVFGLNSYWSYVGRIALQGPADTGAGDQAHKTLHTGASGSGITTIQAKLTGPINSNLSYFVGAGWFALSKKPTGGKSDLGTDVMANFTYKLGAPFQIDFGADWAGLGKAHGEQTSGVSKSRSIIGGWTRLQGAW